MVFYVLVGSSSSSHLHDLHVNNRKFYNPFLQISFAVNLFMCECFSLPLLLWLYPHHQNYFLSTTLLLYFLSSIVTFLSSSVYFSAHKTFLFFFFLHQFVLADFCMEPYKNLLEASSSLTNSSTYISYYTTCVGTYDYFYFWIIVKYCVTSLIS